MNVQETEKIVFWVEMVIDHCTVVKESQKRAVEPPFFQQKTNPLQTRILFLVSIDIRHDNWHRNKGIHVNALGFQDFFEMRRNQFLYKVRSNREFYYINCIR
jgi:hypothetical protein